MNPSFFFFSWIIRGFVQKIEIKVNIDCEKCKHAIMEAVTELEGMISIIRKKRVKNSADIWEIWLKDERFEMQVWI